MDADFWLRILLVSHTLGTTVIGILTYFWIKDRSSAVARALLEQRVIQLEKRMDKAGVQTSELASRVQTLTPRADLDQLVLVVGRLATLVTTLEAHSEEHARVLDDLRLGRRHHDPRSAPE